RLRGDGGTAGTGSPRAGHADERHGRDRRVPPGTTAHDRPRGVELDGVPDRERALPRRGDDPPRDAAGHAAADLPPAVDRRARDGSLPARPDRQGVPDGRREAAWLREGDGDPMSPRPFDLDTFREPSRDHGILPFWFLNGEL